MKAYGLKRAKGCGCNNSAVKRVVKGWKKLYDLSVDYKFKILPRQNNVTSGVGE